MNFGAAGAVARAMRKAWRVCKPIVVLGICLGICWSTYRVIEGQMAILLLAPAIYLAVRRRWALVGVFLLLSPFSVEFFFHARAYALGSSIYVNGNAPICYPVSSIDHRTRIRGQYNFCGNCRLNQVRQFAERSAGVVMYCLMGPPPGAYTGPYPTQAEAEAALALSGTKIEVNSDWIEMIALPSGNVVLQNTIRCWCQEQASWMLPQMLVPTAVIWKQRCLIVKVPRDVDPRPYGPYADIFLIDIQNGQMFGMYSQPK